MYCIHCGERVIESAKFCAACGEKIQRPQGEEQRPERSVLVPPISETSEASGDVAVMPDKVRSAKEAAEYFTQPADGVRFVRHDEILPEPAVSHDEMMKMTTDITIRLANTGSVDAVPAPEDFDDAHRQMWNDLLKEINAIQKRGGIVDIPEDIP